MQREKCAGTQWETVQSTVRRLEAYEKTLQAGERRLNKATRQRLRRRWRALYREYRMDVMLHKLEL